MIPVNIFLFPISSEKFHQHFFRRNLRILYAPNNLYNFRHSIKMHNELTNFQKYLLILSVISSTNMGFLYMSGILDNTAKNLHEFANVTKAAARLSNGVADYFDLFNSLNKRMFTLHPESGMALPSLHSMYPSNFRYEDAAGAKPQDSQATVHSTHSTGEAGSFAKIFCPKFICS